MVVYLKLDHLGEETLNAKLPGILELSRTFAHADPVVEPKLLMTDPFLVCEMPFKTKSFTSVMIGLRGSG